MATFDPIEYLNFLARRWKFASLCVGTALVVAGLACAVIPNRYTATATLLIDPPAASDPRAGSTVSPIYLESLKSYEQFASSDSLFLKACEKFGLLSGDNPPTIETLKRRVLRVDKLKDTRVLEISVTLPDPKKAQAMAQYISEDIVALNWAQVVENDKRALDTLRAQVVEARARMNAARVEQARVVAAGQTELAQEVRSLSGVLEGLEERQAEANAEVAELSARESSLKPFGQTELGPITERLAGAQARQKEIAAGKASVEKRLAEKSAKLSELNLKRDAAADKLNEEETSYRDLQKRETELGGSAGLRSEQLRIIDPGIPPQRPSFPNVPLFLVGALVLSLMTVLAWLSLQFGLARQTEQSARRQLQVARSGTR